MPQEPPATLSPQEVRRTLRGIESSRAQQRRPCRRRSPIVRVPHDEILRVLRDLDRQRDEERAQRRRDRNQHIPHAQPPTTPPPTDEQHGQSPPTPPPTQAKRSPKRPPPTSEMIQQQRHSIESVLRHRDNSFRAKEQASITRSWCNEIPFRIQVDAPRSFYQAFTDEQTLPISHCVFCYRKTPPRDLDAVQWATYLSPFLLQATRSIQACQVCLPREQGAMVNVCNDCHSGFGGRVLPRACSVNNMAIGCEHRYPPELDDLSPVEERLIALHTPFGYITKYTVDDNARSGINYRKHVKGHILVFPNKVEDLVTTVLPHPLLEAIENIHVSWSGAGKPGPTDVRHLLQVRRSKVTTALEWLQKNNPLYENITIDQAEIGRWRYADGSTVPTAIMDLMRREEPSVVERTQTDHIVPDTDRGLEAGCFHSIEDLVNSINSAVAGESSDSGGAPSTAQAQSLLDEITAPALDPAATTERNNAVYETSASAMFPLDGPATFAENDKLSFLADVVDPNTERRRDSVPYAMQVQSAQGQPFVQVERGADFADSLHEDFFPRTFPSLFPWGKGGPKSKPDSCHILQQGPAELLPGHSLQYWARYVLQRHGGRFATHPVFCFLVFNTLLRSSNRRISMVRVTRDSFHRLEQAYSRLTEDRLKRAQDEMRETRTTSDPDVSVLLRELSIFGHAQPLSNESRLLMRRKIQAIDVWTGMPAIWITISPNDINNPVKMKLAAHRLHDREAAEQLLADLREKYDRIALSTTDPVSAAIFFHREVSLFFQEYVKAGQESIFGKVSHYYTAIETNERGSLHLHGLLWLDGNLQLPNLMNDMASPNERAYRDRVIRYVDSVFHECLDEDAGRAIRQHRKPIHPVEETIASNSALARAFEEESNYIAYCCQVHCHTYTCLKYSLKGIVEGDTNPHKRTLCRFRAPWKIVEKTMFDKEGLLHVRRNHPLVNRYNKSLAIGLRHNHDISMILTRTKGLAMVYYITNYATKLDTPVWKRIALAAEVARQLSESNQSTSNAPNDSPLHNQRQPAFLNASRQFLMRAANRIFSERQLSAVEVCYHLLGYPTDFTNVPHWSYLNLTALYWTIFRLWPHLRFQAAELTAAEQPPETVPLRQGGRTLLYLDAYAYRGPILRDVCLYDFMSMVQLVRWNGKEEDKCHIALDGPPSICDGWAQKPRQADQYAIPIFQGYISDDLGEDHPVYVKRYSSISLQHQNPLTSSRNSVLHLALFIPWENFLSHNEGDVTDIWRSHETQLSPRLRFHVSNISLLRKSAEDARRDAKLWASRSEGDDSIDVDFLLDNDPCGEDIPSTAQHRQTYAALVHILRDAAVGTDTATNSPILQNLIRDVCEENPAEEELSLVQHESGLYRLNKNIKRLPVLSANDVQAAAKAQSLLHHRMLDDVASASNDSLATINTDTDMLAGNGTAEIITSDERGGLHVQAPRMLVNVGPTRTFTTLGDATAAVFAMNHLQAMALQLVCAFLDRYTVSQDTTGQHLQYVGGPGGTGKSRIIDALKDVFTARGQSHLLQITGTSGSSAAHVGGTTIHSACGLDTHRASNNGPPPFPEAKKWAWKQKLVLVIDEISMLGGASLHAVHCHLQALRDCSDKPFGGIPVVLLMGDFYQFTPVRELSLLLNISLDQAHASVRQSSISHHSGCALWHKFKTIVLLEEQVRARDDPQFRALLDRVRNGLQTQRDLDSLNANIVDRSQITFHSGLRAITPLNRTRWALNMEAVVGWARFHRRHISIFVSTHTWRSGLPPQNVIARTIGQGDDSACKVPGVFFYAQGIPVVVNKNIYTGLKVVNGAEFTAMDVILDPNHPGHYLAHDVTIHFGPPLGILLQSKDTEAFAIPSLPAGTLLIRPISHTLSPSDPHFQFLRAKCTRRGLPVAPAFVLTDYKAQGKTFVEVLLELRGNRVINGEPSKCDFTSLYVQLSRCTTLRGIKLLGPVRPQDFIGNTLDAPMIDGMRRLQNLAVDTIKAYESTRPQRVS